MEITIGKKMIYECERCNFRTDNRRKFGYHHNTNLHKQNKFQTYLFAKAKPKTPIENITIDGKKMSMKELANELEDTISTDTECSEDEL